MIQLQVKAKTGLHAGATWRFSKSRVTLGASGRADVFLCDPEIPDLLVTFQRYGRRYVVEHLDPVAKIGSLDETVTDNTIYPAMPVNLDFKHVQLEVVLLTQGLGFLSKASEAYSSFFHATLRFLRGFGARAMIAFLFLLGLLMTTLVLFFGTASVTKSQASVLSRRTELIGKKAVQDSLSQVMVANMQRDLDNFARLNDKATINSKASADSLSIVAVLSRDQTQAFENLMQRMAFDYGSDVKIHAQVTLSPEQRFVDRLQIGQVVFGRFPAAILADGTRLYPGGIYHGLTVQQIDQDKVVLQGKAEYVIPI